MLLDAVKCIAAKLGQVRVTIRWRVTVSATVTLPTMVALKDHDAVSLFESGSGVDIVNDADTFMAEVVRVIVELEIMGRPDSGPFQAHWGDLGFDDRISRFESGIRTLNEFEFPRLWYR
jgi:hypothetical protein